MNILLLYNPQWTTLVASSVVKTRLSISLRYCFYLISVVGFATTGNTQTVTTGKSYVNITRPAGGTFLPGDEIEVRATIAVSGGSNTASTRVNNVRYNDTLNLAKFDYVTGSLKMLSNEGRQQYAYTDVNDGDSAHINVANGRLRFNIGDGAGAANVTTQGETTTNSGALWGGLRPSFFGGTCIRMYTYHVKIKTLASAVAIDSTILMSAGNFRYRIGSATTDSRSDFDPYYIQIANDYGLCSNSIGANAIVGESGGTFGSGTPQNRAGGTTFVPAPYTFVNFGANAPNDNYYGLANRTSSDGTTNPNVPYSSGTGSASRVFSVWDIIGDHTGASNPIAGNPPTNTGYAVVINASYQTNRAFTQTISGLCEETYYEFSAWFRNICRRCGCDSSGRGATAGGYVPGPGNDSAGVRPNLSFQIDGVDFYTSGNIPYSGTWIKKGFVFKTKPGQTSFTVTIRNNAPGGGGNDWALDDISVATCLPNMKYSPSITPSVCSGNAFTMYDTVQSYFNNYVHHKWQRSINSGSTWTDVTAPMTPSTAPVWVGSSWQYVSSYTVPPSATNLSNSGDLYRLIVATSVGNLSNASCRSTDANTIVTLTVLNCGSTLASVVNSFTGDVISRQAILKWSTGSSGVKSFDIERSVDGVNFSKVSNVDHNGGMNYSFVDPFFVGSQAYYRIAVKDVGNAITYSSVINLSEAPITKLSFGTVVNPFGSQLVYSIASDRHVKAHVEILDGFGRIIRSASVEIVSGVNQFSFNNLEPLASGVYILRVTSGAVILNKQVIKVSR